MWTSIGAPSNGNCRVNWCEGCREVYRIDRMVVIGGTCDRCHHHYTWISASTPEEISRHIGIPIEQWIDLTQS